MVYSKAAYIPPGMFPRIVPAGCDRGGAKLDQMCRLGDEILCPFALNINSVFCFDANHKKIVPADKSDCPALLVRDYALRQ
jgi:hypothetical protein